MRFAIAAIDRYLGVFESFVHAGWEPLKLFTVPVRHELGNQQAVMAYAERQKAAIQLSRMTEHDLHGLREQGCEALLVASYDWKIPDWRPFLKYAVNFHSSPLPQGRGPYPAVRAILEEWDHWGISCHQLTSDIDKGDILAMEKFPLRADECHESLDLKIQMAARKLATRVAGRFADLWQHAAPQEGGSYWRRYTVMDCIVDLSQPVESILRHVRAFGANKSLVNIDNTWLAVKRAVGWTETHDHAPGHVVHVFNQSVVVAARDGYIGLLDSDLAPPHIVAELKAGSKPSRHAGRPKTA